MYHFACYLNFTIYYHPDFKTNQLKKYALKIRKDIYVDMYVENEVVNAVSKFSVTICKRQQPLLSVEMRQCLSAQT